MPSPHKTWFLPALLGAATLVAPALAAAQPAQRPAPQPGARPAPIGAPPCQGVKDPAVAAECRGLLSAHTLLPQVVAVCGALSPAAAAVRCLHASADRQYAADAIDWCSRRATAEDVVQCFTLTGGENRSPEPTYNDTPTYPVRQTPPKAVPAPAAPGGATDVTRQPLAPSTSPRSPKPEVVRPPSSPPPPSKLDRVGRDVRSAVESPGSDWLERVGRDVRSGAETVGDALRPRPTNDPAYGPDPEVSPP